MGEAMWADFVISAVKRGPTSGRISQLQVHRDLGNSLSKPEIIDKMIVAHNIKKGKKTVEKGKKRKRYEICFSMKYK